MSPAWSLSSRNPILTSGAPLQASNANFVLTAVSPGSLYNGIAINFVVTIPALPGIPRTRPMIRLTAFVTVGMNRGFTDANAVLAELNKPGSTIPFTAALQPGSDGTGIVLPGVLYAAGGDGNTAAMATYVRNGTSLLIAGLVRSLADNSELKLTGANEVVISGLVYVDGTNSDLRIDSSSFVYLDGWVKAQDQIFINATGSQNGLSAIITPFGRVESVAADAPLDPLQTGNSYQIGLVGAGRLEVDGVLQAFAPGADISIHAEKQVLINSAIEADHSVFVDGGDDRSGISVLLPTIAGLNSLGAGGLIDVKGTRQYLILGHIEADGAGSSVKITSEQQVSIGGNTTDINGQAIEVAGFITAEHWITLNGGADPSGISVYIAAASQITTHEIDSSISITAVNDADLYGMILAGGSITPQYVGVDLVGYDLQSYGQSHYGQESQTTLSIRSGNQILVGQNLVAGKSIQVIGGDGGQSSVSLLLSGVDFSNLASLSFKLSARSDTVSRLPLEPALSRDTRFDYVLRLRPGVQSSAVVERARS